MGTKIEHVDYCLDASGLRCPEPLMLVRNTMRDMVTGKVLHVIATDPTTERDFNNYCRFMGHQLLNHEVRGDAHHYWLRKG